MQFKPPSKMANQASENQKTQRATMGWTPYSAVASVCLVNMAAETMATEKIVMTKLTAVLMYETIRKQSSDRLEELLLLLLHLGLASIVGGLLVVGSSC
jgi:hypothetical protein